MKTKLMLCMALGLVILLGGVLSSDADDKKVFRWNLVQHRLTAEPGTAYFVEMFEKTLPAMTNGRLRIKMHWGGDLVSVTEAFDAVQTGMIEMVHLPEIYFMGKIPEAAISYGLPMGIPTPYDMFTFWYGKDLPNWFGGWRAIDFMRDIYSKHGVYLLAGGLDCWPAGFFFRTPINSVNDLRGKKVRAAGLMNTWITKMGGAGVFIPGEEAYSALQTGAIDGLTWGHAAGLYAMKYYEVAKYILYPPLMPVNHSVTLVNKKAWDSLPDDLKSILEQAIIKVSMEFTAHQQWIGDVWSLNKLVRDHGVTKNEFTGKDLEIAQKAAMEIWEEQYKISPEAAKLIEMIKDYMRELGHSTSVIEPKK